MAITGHDKGSNYLFLKISTIWGCITRFPEAVAQKSGDLQKKLKKVHYHSPCRLRCYSTSIGIDSKAGVPRNLFN